MKNYRSGFTFIEVMTVIGIVLIASLLITPTWEKFVHFSRINNIENQIVIFIKNQRIQAQKANQNINIRFRTEHGIPEVSASVYRQENWRHFYELALPPGKVEIFTQQDNLVLTFDHRGYVTSKLPYVIKIATPSRDITPSYRGCVVVWTLTGSIQTGDSPAECPTRDGAPPAPVPPIYPKKN
ncbi:MAG: type II secretion system protein [Cyanobacteria bacterium P01_H01_bin.26]